MLELLSSLVDDGQTLVMVTHEHRAQQFATKVVTLADGRIVEPAVSLHA
jgi:ABC-type lipoprotein export system ATPase subunit